MRCGTLTFPTYRLVPDASWHLEDARIGARSALRRDRGVEVFALGQKALRRYGFAAGTSPSVNLPSPGFAPVARHGLLSAYRALLTPLGPEPPALDPQRLQPLPQRPVLLVRGLRERPLAQLEVRARAHARLRAQRRDPLLGRRRRS